MMKIQNAMKGTKARMSLHREPSPAERRHRSARHNSSLSSPLNPHLLRH